MPTTWTLELARTEVTTDVTHHLRVDSGPSYSGPDDHYDDPDIFRTS